MIFSVSPTGKLLFYSKITLKWIFVKANTHLCCTICVDKAATYYSQNALKESA